MTIFHIPADEVELTAIRSQGPGGQNVNKVASAIQLRFDIRASSLPMALKERLLVMSDHRITQSGVVVIKSQEHRSQDMNRIEALARLMELVQSVAKPPKKRKATKPTYASKQRRLCRSPPRSPRGSLVETAGTLPGR